MTVTSVEQQKKKRKSDKQRYNVFIDGEFSFGAYEDTILKYSIYKGKDLDKETVSEIRHYDEYEFAKKISFDYLSYRIRSESEIKKKLKEKKITLSSIDKVISLLKKLRMINDEEFSRQLISDKVKRKPVGKRVLRQKLFEKGIDKAHAENAIDEFFSNVSEEDLAEQSLLKYLPKVKGETDIMKKKKKCFDYLARKGFDFDVIKIVLNKTFTS